MPPFLRKDYPLAERLAPPLELKLSAGSKDTGAVEGYASAFHGPPDSHGDIIAPGAFLRTITEHKGAGTAPVMLWAHDQAQPIGRWIEMKEDAHGLFVRGQFNLDTRRGRDAHAHVKAGDVSGLSIGYRVAPGGLRAGDNGAAILTDIDLREISVVALPSNQRAKLTLSSKGELEDLLIKSGLSKKAAVRVVAGGWSALAGGSEPDPALIEAVKALDANLLDLKGLAR